MNRRSTLAALLALGLILTACGGDDGGNGDDDATNDAVDTDGSDGGDDGDDAGGLSSDDPEQTTLVLNWVPYGEHAPLYYGVAEGIYEEEGIRLTIQPGSGSGRTVQQVGSGQVDFGWADSPALLNGVNEGLPAKSLGVFLQTTPGSIEFFAEKGYSSPDDLVGETIAGTAGDAMSQTFPAFLAANGLTEEEMTVQNVDAAGKIAALVEGQVDAIMGFCHDQAPTIADISGEEVECMRYSDWGVNFFSTGLISNDTVIDERSELAAAMVRATIRSFEAAQENPEGAIEAMVDAVANQAPPEEVLTEQYELMQDLLHTEASEGMRPGVNVEEDWQATIDVFTEHGDLEDAGGPEAYWTDEFVPED